MTKKIVILSEPLEALDRNKKHESVSGDAVVFAVAAKRLERVIAEVADSDKEVDIAILTALGNDTRGETILEDLRKNGIDRQYIGIIPDKKTGAYQFTGETRDKMTLEYVDRNDSAYRYLFTDKGKETVDSFLAHVDKDTTLVVTGIAVARALDNAAVERLLKTMREAKKRGAKVVVDPETRARVWENNSERAKQVLTKVFKEADMVFFSHPEDNLMLGQQLFGWNTPKNVAQGLRGLGVKNIVVRKGEDGVDVYTERGAAVHIPVNPHYNIPKEEVADTAGAGLTFMAGMLLGEMHGMSPLEAAKVAQRAATQVVRHEGMILRDDHIPPVNQLRDDRIHAPHTEILTLRAPLPASQEVTR